MSKPLLTYHHNCKLTKPNFISDQMFRQMSPSTPFGRLEQINWVSDQINLDIIGEKFSHTDIRPSTNWTSQPPTFMRDERTHSRLYPV